MRNEKELLKQWKADLHAIKEEKKIKKRKKKNSKKYAIPGSTANFMNSKNVFYKKNGVWRQSNHTLRND